MDVERRKTTEEEIKEVETLIVNNSKDAHFAKGLIQRLSGLYQMDKLIDVPMKDVKDTIELGACAIYKVKDGYVFEAKGGMQTFVSRRMASVCTMLNTLFELRGSEDKNLYGNFAAALEYIFEAPIFSSLDERALFDNATAILRSFNEYCKDNYTNAEAVEETEVDVKANVAAEQAAKAMEILAESPLPPED